MGLDISAYCKATKLNVIFDEDGEALDKQTCEPVGYDVRVFVNPHFPGREDGVEDGAAYTAEERMSFSTGYGAHGAWRENLAKLAGYAATAVDNGFGRSTETHSGGAWSSESGPFWELINFSDCEGVIGPVVSAKLSKDFAEWDELAKQFDEANALEGRFYKRFQDWRKAFEMAADGGLVNFH